MNYMKMKNIVHNFYEKKNDVDDFHENYGKY